MHSAFTLLELMIVIVVIGFMATITIPRLMRKSPNLEWENVLEEINNLVNFARQEAISHQKTYRLLFQINKRDQDTILVETENPDPEDPHKTIYTAAKSYFKTIYNLPKEIRISAIHHGVPQKKESYACFVIPNGLVQDILVHLVKEEKNTTSSKVSLKMSPFIGKFELFEGFIKPAK